MRVPPHSLDAERALLGLAIAEGSAVVRQVDGLLDGDDCYLSAHRTIWRAIASVSARGDSVDMLTVRTELERRGELQGVGGDEYLLGLMDTLAGSDAETLARMIRDDAQRRAIITVCHEQAAVGYSRDVPTRDYVEQTSARLYGATRDEAAGRGGLRDARDSLISYWTRTQQVRAANGLLGVRTCIDALDSSIVGLWDGDLVVVAGRPSMGKTAMLETLAINVAQHIGKGDQALFFSAEMGEAVLWPRLLSKLAGVSSRYVRDFDPAEKSQMARDVTCAIDEASRLPLRIDDTSGITIGQIRQRSRRAAASGRVRAVFVDYVQIVKASGKHERHDLAIAEVATSLKELARELDCPVVAAAQINRGAVNRTDKRPMISDIKDSGMIEQAADLILMLHRESYYQPDAPDKGQAEIIVGKNRNGETGTIRTRYIPERCQFVDDAGPSWG